MRFSDITAPAPEAAGVRAAYDTLVAAVRGAATPAEALAAVDRWERVRRTNATYAHLAHLRYSQNVDDAQARAAKEAMDELEPVIKEHEVAMMRAMLESPHRAALEAELGSTAFALWECEITTFDPAIAEDLIAESRLVNEVMALTARATVEFDGRERNLSELVGLLEHHDRDTRYRGARAYWQWFEDNGAVLDRLFAELTRLRCRMASTLGYESFTELGYRIMSRIDYDQGDVERFRAQVRDTLVPLCAELRRRQAATLGIDRVMYWDEKVFDPAGAAVPMGGEQWMVERAREMFAELHPELQRFFDMMADGGFLDLPSRQGKAGGGFCTSFPSEGVPFIFANFNGTSGDVRVFTHEAGHAFQCWMSREQRLTEYLWPTIEACEIHSMSLEFLTYPSMGRFFGDAAERFLRDHLAEALLFIPYGVAIDHFQHLVYARPEATPEERHQMWREMERTYLPWRDYGDLPRASSGAFWQRQMHVFFRPFYYIDYTLAQTCALQFWVRALEDPRAAVEDYVALCRRGGEAPFQELARSAGLRSPFEEGCLDAVVARASATLG